jgi:hypothetical protein
MRSVTPPEAQQWRLVLLQTNEFPKDRMNNVKMYMLERRPSSESAKNRYPFVSYPQSARRYQIVEPYIHRARNERNGKQPFSAFDRVGGSRMQGMSICGIAEASSGSFNK